MEVNSLNNGGAATGAKPQPTVIAADPVSSVEPDAGVVPRSSFVEDCIACREGRAVEVFRSELSRAVEAELKVRVRSADSAYPGDADSDDVVPEVLRSTQRVAEANPDVSRRVVARVRQNIQTAAEVAATSVAQDDATGDIESDVGRLEAGLRPVEEFAARQIESSASVLSIDTRVRQRSAIRIRTQEGDIVQLVVGFGRRLSAQSSNVQGDGFGVRETAIAVAERSSLKLRVKGDLNDAELAAIRSVFEQAERIADEFFAGDLRAALGSAVALEYDTGQLAAVNLRLRSRAVSNVAYAQASAREPVALEAPEATPEAAEPKAAEVTPKAPAASEVEVADVAEASPAVEAVEQPDAGADPVSRFFDLLSDFLKGVSDGFEGRRDSGFTFHYSQSFKLQILKSVFELVSPSTSDGADAATSLIDAAAAEDAADD